MQVLPVATVDFIEKKKENPSISHLQVFNSNHICEVYTEALTENALLQYSDSRMRQWTLLRKARLIPHLRVPKLTNYT